MVKLTTDIIDNAKQCINAVKDRELDLRGYKIPIIENLGATYDQYDTIDLCENDIRKLDGFPHLQRLKTLLLHHNRITRVAENIADQIPHLETLAMCNNNFQELGDLEPLSKLKRLEYLSLIGSPVAAKSQYRLFVVFKLPSVRVLDFKRIKQVEREEAKAMFKGKRGKALQEKIVRKTLLAVAAEEPELDASTTSVDKRPMISNIAQSAEDIKAIKDAIVNAKSLEEVERLNSLLQSGQIPGKVSVDQLHQPKVNGAATEQMDET